MRIRNLTLVLAIAGFATVTAGAAEGRAPAPAAKAAAARSETAKPAAAAPAAPTAPSVPGAVAGLPAPDEKSEGSAVVEKILKEKEDLLSGKRFVYDPAGRRDPFRSLLDQVSAFHGPRPKGIKGMLISEAELVGTVKDPRGDIAFFKGSDNKGYFLHVGDELYDGRIISINPETGTVTFRQQVDDPRQIKPYRDITKRVTPLAEEEAQ